jgi:FtsP/CotA-like multicopper oxidase with cupredoxin domain
LRSARVRWSIPAVTVLFAVTGCGGDEPTTTAAPPAATTTAASAPTAADPTTSVTPPAVSAVDREIVVTVADQKVSPPTGRIEVRRGATVRITVTSDVTDDLHVHGYDLTKSLPAGRSASIEFRADRSGLFEVETHEAHLVLFQLVVR